MLTGLAELHTLARIAEFAAVGCLLLALLIATSRFDAQEYDP